MSAIGASFLGGIVAYGTAYLFFDAVATMLLSTHALSSLHQFVERLNESVFVLTLVGAVTPIPYTLVAYAAGFAKGSIVAFAIASILGRAARLGVVGFLTHRFGAQALAIFAKRFRLGMALLMVLGVAYIALKFGDML